MSRNNSQQFSSRLSFQNGLSQATATNLSVLQAPSSRTATAQVSSRVASNAAQRSASTHQAAASVNQIARDLIELNRITRQSQRASTAALSRASASFAAASAAASAAAASRQSTAVAAASSNRCCDQQNGSRAGSANASGAYVSEFEQQLLRAQVPIELSETEEITVNGERGIWANRAEVVNWKGVVPIAEYKINEDANPEVITKRTEQRLEYIQELAIRYLRPPTPPAPGEILIKQDCNTLAPPAPPLIIRQQPPRPDTPEPLVVREAPPQPPPEVGKKVITISGKRIPPPPRKVIIERLAALPSKPQSVLIERWLPYAQVKRRVIYQNNCCRDPVVVNPRNVIVQWEAPEAVVKKEFKYLGVIKANPVEYVQRYGAELKTATQLPEFVHEIKTPEGLVLAADYTYNELHELEGDVHALKFVDLDAEGLGAYREFLSRFTGSTASLAATAVSAALSIQERAASAASASASVAASASASATAQSRLASASQSNFNQLIETIFRVLDINQNGEISREETEKAVLRINSRLGRRYGEDDVQAFFAALDSNNNGSLDLEEFKRAFLALHNNNNN